jgi:hypothetical protein
MGVIFSLYKRKPKQRYELGKPRRGYAPGMAPPDRTLTEKIGMLTTAFKMLVSPGLAEASKYYTEVRELTDPGWGAMWSIMDDPNYAVFKMSRWSREELADKLFRGSANIGTLDDALRVADDILRWAGDGDITLNPEEPGDLAELGWPTRGYKDAGSIWDAMGAE